MASFRYFLLSIFWHHGGRRWVALTGPTILVKLASWAVRYKHPFPPNQSLASIWQPPWWMWGLAVAAGLLIAAYLAWLEQFKLNKSLTDGFPLIVLAEHPIETTPFQVYRAQDDKRVYIATYTSLRLRVGNKPDVNTAIAATRLNARISFYDESRSRRHVVMDGRWADSPQMVERNTAQDYVESLSVPFPVGAERSLDILFKRPEETICTAVNNDNFASPTLAMPGRELSGIVTVFVELNGTYVKTKIVFKISCDDLRTIGTVQISDSTPRLRQLFR